MRYPVAIEPGTQTDAYSVIVPDLPGCFSAGDTLDEAMLNTEEAIAAWIDAALDAGHTIPHASDLETVRKSFKAPKGWVWALIQVDPALLDDTTERINISLPRRILSRLDALARAAGESRSGFIAKLTLEH